MSQSKAAEKTYSFSIFLLTLKYDFLTATTVCKKKSLSVIELCHSYSNLNSVIVVVVVVAALAVVVVTVTYVVVVKPVLTTSL